jgi:hypothetical protein
MQIKPNNIELLSVEQNIYNILLKFDIFIDQEELPEIANGLWQQFSALNKLEHNLGADRESYRFEWQGTQFDLNFESYSQSIWIEPLVAEHASETKALFNYLTI